ncbi:MAG: caspase family protein, partial [Verrucomicrobium sp.]
MPTRALIIAIGKYPSLADQMAGTLDETLQAPRNFRRWLLEKKKVKPENLLFCSEPGVDGETTYPATREGIKLALLKLIQEGRDNTEELYVAFSGHGYAQLAFADEVIANVLLASDYKDSVVTAESALKLEPIVRHLRTKMGPGEHYYFIDACRVGRGEQFEASDLIINLPRSQKEEPKESLLFSTAVGEVATVNEQFGRALIDGLGGRGRAKTWFDDGGKPPKLVVRFGSLAEFIKKRMAPRSP